MRARLDILPFSTSAIEMLRRLIVPKHARIYLASFIESVKLSTGVWSRSVNTYINAGEWEVNHG
jgi:hypothetical protein